MSGTFRIAVACGSLLAETKDKILPGLCFGLLKQIYAWGLEHAAAIEIAVVSHRSPETGGRMMGILSDHGLDGTSGFFSNGDDVLPYVIGMDCDLFMSDKMDDVQRAIDAGVPAAMMHGVDVVDSSELRIAFDGDAVLLSHKTEKLFQENGIKAFLKHERDNVDLPIAPGPLLPFLRSLNRLEDTMGAKLFKTALVTARSGGACERAMRTLTAHGVRIDQALFCGNIPKLEILRAFGAHVFFDDSDRHLKPASLYLTTGKVPWRTSA